MTPKFVASFIKAADLADRGLTTRVGNQVMAADQFDAWDIAYKAAGFNPTSVSEHYAAQASKEDTAQAIKDRREGLLREYAQAKIQGDDVNSVRDAIKEFNAEHKKARIDASALLKATQSRRKSAETLDEAGVSFNKNEKYLKGIDRFAY